MTIDAISGAAAASSTSPIETTSPGTPAVGEGSGARPSLSGPAQFFSKLQSLEQSDPAKAKQVLGDIASELKSQAVQATGAQADRLSQLADRFQKAADSGDLSSTRDPKSVGGHSTGASVQPKVSTSRRTSSSRCASNGVVSQRPVCLAISSRQRWMPTRRKRA